jgi:predicted nucleic acid-binding protein
MIIIDTDVLIEIFDKHSNKGKDALNKLEKNQEDISITSLNLHEILFGHNKRNKNISDIYQIQTIPFTKQDAILSAELESNLEKQGKVIARTDAMIAAIAINNNAKLFTFNLKHFEIIPKIKLFK